MKMSLLVITTAVAFAVFSAPEGSGYRNLGTYLAEKADKVLGGTIPLWASCPLGRLGEEDPAARPPVKKKQHGASGSW